MLSYDLFAQNLRGIIGRREISQKELADMLNISQQTVSRWIQGINAPSLERFVQLCNTLDINAEDLIGSNDDSELPI